MFAYMTRCSYTSTRQSKTDGAMEGKWMRSNAIRMLLMAPLPTTARDDGDLYSPSRRNRTIAPWKETVVRIMTFSRVANIKTNSLAPDSKLLIDNLSARIVYKPQGSADDPRSPRFERVGMCGPTIGHSRRVATMMRHESTCALIG